jgi:DNA replication protein DnaC
MLQRGQKRGASCDQHGQFESEQIGLFREVWSKCPVCEKEAEQANLAAEAQRAAAEASERKANTFEAAGVPVRFRDRTLENYTAESEGQKFALKWAQEYAYNFDEVLREGRSMLFLGRPGTGKTHLACAIASHLIFKGVKVYYSTVQRALRRIKDTWNRETTKETEGQPSPP